jgi:hypothetical protein
MKKSILIAFALLTVVSSTFAQEIKRELKSFSRIIASPRVNLILKQGDKESIRLVYHDVSESKINIEVSNHTLHVYLDNARKVEKVDPYEPNHGRRRNMYDGVSITAYVTYTYLEGLEMRGNQELTCYDPIESDEFRLKAYGENEITLASLKTDFFKVTMYGTNDLKISKGKVVEQKYKLYGENKIDTRALKSAYASASIFGEGQVRLNSTEEVRVDAFGEPNIYVDGGAHVNRRLVIGRTNIHRD